MNLPKLFTAQEQSDEPRLVLALILSQVRLQALLLRIQAKETSIAQKSRALEYSDNASAPVKADEALQDLGPDSESVNQTIFCLESSWVKDGDIIEGRRPLVKKITTDLSLEALGFIVTSEALAHFYIQQNALFSGLLFLFSSDHIHVSWVAQGKIQTTQSVGRSDNSVADIEEALARCSARQKASQGGQLPAKMILASFDLTSDELHKQQQQLLEYPWDDQNIFMQAPTIDVVSPEVFIDVIAAEAARAVALAQGLPAPTAPPAVARAAGLSAARDMAADADSHLTPDSEQSKSIQSVNDSDAGKSVQSFLDDNLVALEQSPLAATPLDDVERAVDTAATSFGVPIAAHAVVAAAPKKNVPADFGSEFAELDDEKDAVKSTKKTGSSFFSHLFKPYKGKKKPAHFALFGLVAGLIVLAVAGVLAPSFLARAKVEVTLQKRDVSKEIQITLDPKASATDPDELVLAADEATKTVEDESSMQTTGVKLVGDKAKGKVLLINKTEGPKTFAAGTLLAGKGKNFVLDAEVSVASASAHTGGITFGQAEGAVTAAEIGEESNLPKETDMSIEKYATDTFAAVVKDGLTGGASREVRVVSAKDMQELLSDLRADLLKKANEEFASESTNGVYFLPNPTIVKETPTYSKKEGDESNELTLTLKLDVRTLSYTAADLEPIARAVLTSEVPSGYELVQEDPQILSAPDQPGTASGSAKTQTSLTASISNDAFPVVDEEQLKQTILGKSIAKAEEELAAQDTIQSAHVSISPALFGSFIKNLPNDSKRVTLILKRE